MFLDEFESEARVKRGILIIERLKVAFLPFFLAIGKNGLQDAFRKALTPILRTSCKKIEVKVFPRYVLPFDRKSEGREGYHAESPLDTEFEEVAKPSRSHELENGSVLKAVFCEDAYGFIVLRGKAEKIVGVRFKGDIEEEGGVFAGISLKEMSEQGIIAEG